jgi:hypothetical protein
MSGKATVAAGLAAGFISLANPATILIFVPVEPEPPNRSARMSIRKILRQSWQMSSDVIRCHQMSAPGRFIPRSHAPLVIVSYCCP